MNQNKINNRIESKKAFDHNNIKYVSLNDDFQWKVGTINFFPTTFKWHDQKNGRTGHGLISGIKYIKGSGILGNLKEEFTVQDFYKIALKSEDKTMAGTCEAIHRAVYNKGEE